MFPPGKEKCKDMIGIFELCNPHLLSEEILIAQLTSKFPLYSLNMTKAQALDLFCSHISPKVQRAHQDSRKGILLKRLQKDSMKKNLNESPKNIKIMGDGKGQVRKSPIKEQEIKRVSNEPGGPEAKRSRITSFTCQDCDESLKSHSLLVNHVENIHVKNEGKRREYLFPQKCPNCPKWIYYDEENEEHYDDFEEFGRCEARKEKELLSSRSPCDPENLG